MKRTDRAYLAGVLDGEGSISLVPYRQVGEKRRRRGGWNLAIEVVNRNEDLIFWLLEKFGGTKNSRARGGNRALIHVWRIYGRNCLPVLEASLPYLIVKRTHAELALEFIETINLKSQGSSVLVTDEIADERELLAIGLGILNERGGSN